MKPMPKGSLFNSLSSDMVTNVAFVKVCALPSARSSFFFFFLDEEIDSDFMNYWVGRIILIYDIVISSILR